MAKQSGIAGGTLSMIKVGTMPGTMPDGRTLTNNLGLAYSSTCRGKGDPPFATGDEPREKATAYADFTWMGEHVVMR